MSLHDLVLAAILCGSLAQAALCAPVQWPVSAGGNNHFYELVAPPSGITWTDARTEATTASVYGVAGHLVTISDLAEWNFVIGQFPRDWTWIGLTDEAQEGNFQWVTNEPVAFTRWIPREPNNAGTENYVFYQQATALGGAFGWNDYRNVPSIISEPLPLGYVREFDTVPEPSSVVLLALGCAAVAVSRRRLFRKPRGRTR
jgi:hypothetical protein